MGIPLWRPPSPPSTDPILSPSTSHRLAVQRRRAASSSLRPTLPRERSSQTLFELLRSNDPVSSSSSSSSATSTSSSSIPSERARLQSQIWRELNTIPRQSSSEDGTRWRRRMRSPGPEASSLGSRTSSQHTRWRAQHMARLVDLDRQREAVRQERERMQRDSEELTTGIRETSGREYFMTRAATSAFGRHQQFQHWADENERPPQPPRSWFADGLGDRERSLSPDPMSLWPAVWPDDLGIATACELWDEEDLMGLGPGIGAGSIEESLMEFWRRREEIDSRAAAREPEFAGDPTERERVRERANVERAARMAASVERNNTERSERLVALGRLVGRAIL